LVFHRIHFLCQTRTALTIKCEKFSSTESVLFICLEGPNTDLDLKNKRGLDHMFFFWLQLGRRIIYKLKNKTRFCLSFFGLYHKQCCGSETKVSDPVPDPAGSKFRIWIRIWIRIRNRIRIRIQIWIRNWIRLLFFTKIFDAASLLGLSAVF